MRKKLIAVGFIGMFLLTSFAVLPASSTVIKTGFSEKAAIIQDDKTEKTTCNSAEWLDVFLPEAHLHYNKFGIPTESIDDTPQIVDVDLSGYEAPINLTVIQNFTCYFEGEPFKTAVKAVFVPLWPDANWRQSSISRVWAENPYKELSNCNFRIDSTDIDETYDLEVTVRGTMVKGKLAFDFLNFAFPIWWMPSALDYLLGTTTTVTLHVHS